MIIRLNIFDFFCFWCSIFCLLDMSPFFKSCLRKNLGKTGFVNRVGIIGLVRRLTNFRVLVPDQLLSLSLSLSLPQQMRRETFKRSRVKGKFKRRLRHFFYFVLVDIVLSLKSC